MADMTDDPNPDGLIVMNCIDPQEIYGGSSISAELAIELDEDGIATLCAYSIPVGSWLESKDVDCGLTLRWTARDYPDLQRVVADVEEIRKLVDELRPLLERVHAGHVIDDNGHYRSGRLDEDATEASQAIEFALEHATWTTDDRVGDAYEWLECGGWSRVIITAHTTDEEIEAMIEPLAEQAREEEVIVYNIEGSLRYRRDELLEEEGV